MPRITRPDWTPTYALHKRSGLARVRIPGKGEVWLPGPYGSAESRRSYDREVAAWIAAGRPGVQRPGAPAVVPPASPAPGGAEVTMVELVAPFLQHCRSYYAPREGARSATMYKVRRAMALLLELYDEIPATTFGPRELEALQTRMIGLGLSRATINGYIAIVRMMMKFAVRRQLVPAAALHGLSAVDGLRKGRSSAREPGPVRPIAAATIDATLRHSTPIIADMVRLQLLTGARPGEICSITGGDIDTSGPIWIYTPRHHKTEHHGKQRVIAVGPRAQAILGKYLRPELDRPLFSPADAEEQRNAARRTRAPRGQGRRRVRPPGQRYDVNSYRRAIWRACDRAFSPPAPLARRPGESGVKRAERLTAEQHAALREWQRAHRWHLNQLRHSRATDIRKQYGLEAAGAVLGHARLSTTEVYAEKSVHLAARVAAEVG